MMTEVFEVLQGKTIQYYTSLHLSPYRLTYPHLKTPHSLEDQNNSPT